jgi:hypothetical protein
MGFTQRQIAERIGVSSVQICFDLRKLRKRYVEQANVHAGERIGETLAAYRDVRREAWQAWERSCLESRRVTTRTGGKNGDAVTTTVEARLPGAEYLQVVLDTYAAERKVLGLDQESPALFLTPDAVVTVAKAIMSAIGRRVNDPQLVQQMKQDVLDMLPRSVEVPDSTIAEATSDAEPTAMEPVADEPDDAPQPSIAADPPAPYAAAALNGVQGGGDEFALEEPV